MIHRIHPWIGYLEIGSEPGKMLKNLSLPNT